MISREDALTYKTFYHKSIRHPDGRPLACVRCRKPRIWKRKPGFYMRIRYLDKLTKDGTWMTDSVVPKVAKVTFYDYITSEPVDEYEDVGGRMWLIGREWHSFRGPRYKSNLNWYCFDPTNVKAIDLEILRNNLHCYQDVPKDVTKMPLAQLYDWIQERPQYNGEYCLYEWGQFTTPLETLRMHLEAQRDGLPIRPIGGERNVPC